jgi:cytochrome bd-type quinol oxidase subunit 2
MANAAGSLEERRLGRTFLSGLHAAFSFGAACAVGVTYLLNGPARYNLAFIVAGVVCLLGAAVSLRLPVADGLPMNEDGVENHDLRPIAVVAAVLAFVVVVGSSLWTPRWRTSRRCSSGRSRRRARRRAR